MRKFAIKTSVALIATFAGFAPSNALSQIPATQPLQGVGVADYDRSVQNATAYLAALGQLKSKFQPLLDSVEARGKVLDAELKSMVDKFQADRKANPASPALKAAEQAIVQKQQAGRDEVAKMAAPYTRARQYVLQQFNLKLKAAVDSAMTKRRVGVIVNPESVIGLAPSNDVTGDITAELNMLVPTASIEVPSGWQPGQ